ncbi:MAG: glycosyltransferase [Bacteroidales bacterium]|nr:glycosyltransferase [Bacteroidales bacterium]
MKISLLIPVFDYDIVELVHCMKGAIDKVPELYEIIIGDDGSSAEYKELYKSLEGNNVRVISSENNIGRAAIRNRLALEAKGDYLLFVDADATLPGTAEAYLKKWLTVINRSMVLCGGTLYHGSPPGDPDRLLRWKYGKRKEEIKASERNKHPHAGFSTFNVIFDKSVFSKIRFDEELKQYGHEDTLMGYQLRKAGIDVLHIDNGLLHGGLESNKDFLDKTRLGIENLSRLFDSVTDKKVFSECVRIIRIYNKCKFLRLTQILSNIYLRYSEKMEIRLDTPDMSLCLFSFYKICMFCSFREIQSKKKVL